MAVPKAMKKRPAAASAGGSSKKLKKEQGQLKKRFELIQEAIGEATLEKSVQQMLQKVVPSTLNICADVRHPYQVQCVDMIGEALAGVQRTKEAEKASSQAKVDGMDTERVQRDEAVTMLQNAVMAAKATHQEKEQAAEAADSALKGAKIALKEAESSAKTGEKEISCACSTKEVLVGAQAKTAQLKEAAANRTCINEVVGAARKGNCDENLLKTLPEVLSKAPEDRGTFDGTAYATLVQFFEKAVNDATQLVEEGDTKKVALEKALEHARTALTTATENAKAAHTAKLEASHAEGEAASTLKAGEKAVKSFGSDQNTAACALKEATADLEDFMTGAQSTFQELRDKKTPQPEPELPVEAPQPEPVLPVEAAVSVEAN